MFDENLGFHLDEVLVYIKFKKEQEVTENQRLHFVNSMSDYIYNTNSEKFETKARMNKNFYKNGYGVLKNVRFRTKQDQEITVCDLGDMLLISLKNKNDELLNILLNRANETIKKIIKNVEVEMIMQQRDEFFKIDFK